MVREEAMALAIKGWNALYANQPMKVLRYAMFGARVESFPTMLGVDYSRF